MSAIKSLGPGCLNQEASSAYKKLSKEERECLKTEARRAEVPITKKEAMRRGEKIFSKIKDLVMGHALYLDLSTAMQYYLFISLNAIV